MTSSAEPDTAADLPEGRFSNRELSWLAFNERVLALAEDERQPLLERMKFLAIFASNLDEFYMVRVAGLKRRADMGLQVASPDGLTPREVLAALGDRDRDAGRPARPLLPRRRRARRSTREGIHIRRWDALDDEEKARLGRVLPQQDLPGADAARRRPGAPVPLHLRAVAQPRRARARRRRRRPSASPGSRCRTTCRGSWSCRRPPIEAEFLPLEDLIAAHLAMLFPGMEVVEHHLFRVTRNADFEVEEDRDEDLLQALERELMRRRFGPAVRLEVADDIDDEVVELLVSEIDVDTEDVQRVPGLLDLSALWQVYDVDRPALKERPFVPATHPRFAEGETPKSVFATLRDGDVLVHHPYESFATSVQRFIEQAAADPNVLAIKQTLYRTSGDSPIVDALIDAAEAGKQVVALVEIKARFDEQANIKWARALERAGCHVVYGVVGLKTHCKTALVVRQEGSQIRRYAHIGTGNYNPKTARMYEDLGLFTADEDDLRRPHRPVQRAHRLLAPDRVPLAAGRAARRARRADRPHRARDRARPRRAGRRTSSSRPTTSSTSRSSTRCTARRRPACGSTCWCARSARSAPASPGCRRTSRRARSSAGSSSTRASTTSATTASPEYWIGSADLMHRNLDRRVEVLVPGVRPAAQRAAARACSTSRSPPETAAWELRPGRRVGAHRRASDYQELLMHRLADRGE